MRMEKSILNIGSNFLILLIRTILSFIVRTIFIKTLGEEYLGINGLFTNILIMLSVAELGITSAINFSLYKPLATKDYEKVSILMSFYRRVYRVIGFITLCLGLIVYVNLDFFISDYGNINNVDLIYFMFLLNTVFLYFITYKETLIMADQNNYELTKIILYTSISTYIIQMIILLIFKNFCLYLLVEFLINILQKHFINKYIDKKYHFIDFRSKKKIEKKEFNEIIKNVKALMIFKLGNYFINGTDNIILSKYIGLTAVGIYSNYLSLISIVDNFIRTIFNGVSSSYGNLVATENEESQKNVFKILDFISFVLYGLTALIFCFLFNPFITIWIGEKYTFSMGIVILLSVRHYTKGIQINHENIRIASGMNHKSRYVPIIEATLNIILSIYFVKRIGIIGVFVGTLLSSIPTIILIPYTLYKFAFKSNVFEYYYLYIKYALVILIDYFIINFIFGNILLEINLFNIIIKGIIICVIFLISVVIFYRNTKEFKFVSNKILEGVFK